MASDPERPLFKRFRDHYLIGPGERFKVYDGFDIYRVLLPRPGEDTPILAVYAASQERHQFDADDAMRGLDMAFDDADDDEDRKPRQRAHVGPSPFGSQQLEFIENPSTNGADIILDYARLVHEAQGIDAVERADYLERWFREQLGEGDPDRQSKAKEAVEAIPKGDLVDVAEVWVYSHYFRRRQKTIDDDRRKIFNRVRRTTATARKKLAERESTRWIADYLKEHVHIGMTCRYTGTQKWTF